MKCFWPLNTISQAHVRLLVAAHLAVEQHELYAAQKLAGLVSLSMKLSAPHSSPRITSWGSDSVVTRMTGTSAMRASVLIRWHSS